MTLRPCASSCGSRRWRAGARRRRLQRRRRSRPVRRALRACPARLVFLVWFAPQFCWNGHAICTATHAPLWSVHPAPADARGAQTARRLDTRRPPRAARARPWTRRTSASASARAGAQRRVGSPRGAWKTPTTARRASRVTSTASSCSRSAPGRRRRRTCPVSTEGGTRRVQLVREGGGRGGGGPPPAGGRRPRA